MSRDPRLYLDDILDAISAIQRYIDDYDYMSFVEDKKTQDAVVRNLEVIGEAVNHLPETVRSLANDIEWRKISDLRNILIHQYFGISVPIIWDIVMNKLEPLRSACEKIFEHLKHD